MAGPTHGRPLPQAHHRPADRQEQLGLLRRLAPARPAARPTRWHPLARTRLIHSFSWVGVPPGYGKMAHSSCSVGGRYSTTYVEYVICIGMSRGPVSLF